MSVSPSRPFAVKTSGGEVRLTYRWQGFGRAPHGALLCEAFVAHATREREAVLFAAALLDARATEDLEAALHTASPHLSRTARLLVRGILPELRDRFPAAAALLATLGRRAGERIPLTPRAVEDP